MLRNLPTVALALVFSFVFVSPISALATDWVNVEKNLKKRSNSQEFIEQVVDQYGFRGAVRVTMTRHLREMYRSDIVIKALLEEVRNLGVGEKINLLISVNLISDDLVPKYSRHGQSKDWRACLRKINASFTDF